MQFMVTKINANSKLLLMISIKKDFMVI